ncbi:MAG: threonine synthase [Clostridia bacterium]|nr:threonine synthase [Clostridia bacterium]
MNYNSTRDSKLCVTAAGAIAKGISNDGGLFVPETIPTLSDDDFNTLCSLDYIGRAKFVLKYFLTDFTEQEIDYCVRGAYSDSFDNNQPAPLKCVDGKNMNLLELWHGPTCAFKDLALQLLPYLLVTSAKKVANGKETIILVATSGDTGKAALEGFKDVENTKIIVFYPQNGVSNMQKLQMDTQEGENVFVCGIKGNFDDAQSGVKKIFTNPDICKKLEENGMQFSSANSINWGRLVPQIIYYISAYCDLVNSNKVTDGFNVVVPTGNFGNILAAYYAKAMGVPIKKLICASNANNVLTDFLKTGTYDRNRQFFTTISPSMDILISSNLERMLYELSGRDDAKVKDLQEKLAKDGKYTVDSQILEKIQEIFYGGCCDDAQTKDTINQIFKDYGYLCDTHTAVAVKVYKDYVDSTGDDSLTVIASTASPYKFAADVLESLGQATADNDFETLEKLMQISGVQIPAPIANLKGNTPRFSNVCEKENLDTTIFDFLKI